MRTDERVQAVLQRPAVATLIVAVAAAWLLWPVPLGHPPISQDHTVHLFRAWHFFTKLLGEGRLMGWSDYWFAGWPAGEDYPPGADWWLAAARLLTLPFSWETTYAFGFFAMYVLGALALWRAARPLGAIAAVLGAVLFVLDRGEYREGGFLYSVHWGVWPQQLSTALLFLGLAWLDEALTAGGPRRFAQAGLALGWSLLCHPMSLVSLSIALPALILTHRAFVGTPLIRTLGRSLGVVLLAALMAAYFTVPFAAHAGFMASYGDPYRPLSSIALGLLRGDLFRNVPAPLVWLGLLGIGLGFWRRDRTAVFLGLFFLATLVVASSSMLGILERISPSFGRIQYQRLVITAKACLFLLAAWTLAPSWGPAWWRRIGWASLLLAPILVGAGHPSTRVHTAGTTDGRDAYAEFLSWSRAEKARSTEFYRIAYVGPYNNHYFAAAPVWNDTPAYKAGFTPASVFVHKPDQANPELFRVLGVKWVVARGAWRMAGLRVERRFGPIVVYRFGDYDPRRFTMRGAGSARAERFADEHVRIALEGTDDTSRVVLHVARHPSWRARLDGREVPIRTVSLASEPIFMEIPAHGRRLEVDFQVSASHLAGRALTILALLIVAFLLLAPARASALGARLPAMEAVLIGVVVLALASVATAKLIRRPPPPLWRALDAIASAEAWQGDRPCERRGDRLQCSERGWNYVGSTRLRIGGIRKHCIWAHPRSDTALRIRFADLPAGNELRLYHGLSDTSVDAVRNGAPVRVDVSVAGRPAASGVQPNRKGWSSFRVPLDESGPGIRDVQITIRTARDAARHFCFDAEVR